MDYTNEIATLRSKREQLINKFRHEKDQESEHFDYYPIHEKWRVPATLTTRKPKEGMTDYSINFVRVGKIDLLLEKNPLKFDLYQVENEESSLYIYIKDGTSAKTTYGLGRFVPILKINDSYFADFNLAFTPACGHVEGTACPWARESTGIAIEAGEKASLDH